MDAVVTVGGCNLAVSEFESVAPYELDAVANGKAWGLFRTGFLLDNQATVEPEKVRFFRAFARVARINQEVDDPGVEEWIVGGDANEPVGIPFSPDRDKARQNFGGMSPEDTQAEFEAPGLGDIVCGIGAGGEPPLVDSRCLKTFRYQAEDRLPAERRQDFARESLRAHSRLDDADRSAQGRPSRSHRKIPLLSNRQLRSKSFAI
jgi:hypothetical protein